MIIRKIYGILLVLVFVSILVLGGLQVSAVDKIPNFGTVKESNMKVSYFVFNTNGKVKKVRMPEIETIIISRLFNTNNYTEAYIQSQFTVKITNPYIEVHVNPHRIVNLYCSNSGFVYLDMKKYYYVDQDRYPTFFNYCKEKYVSKKDKIKVPDGKYKPMKYNMKNFLADIKKYGCQYKSLKSNVKVSLHAQFSTLIAYGEEIDVFCYKDNIDMELGSMETIGILGDGSLTKGPHLYKKGNIIVLYNGYNEKIISSIEKAMGKYYLGW